ncbi:MAG: hypothetical protein CVU91_07540 [Firmicutes bacterium HGW-Firmicutes-16]|nr:MAG: hypothetical protein CVU91_07540 [Firmicutes bacterium HGW-Firmicutes-16]
MCNCFNKMTLYILIFFLLIGFLVFVIVDITTPAALGGIQAQLDDSGGEIQADGSNVIFNTELNDQSSAISYNSVTGEFTIAAPGNYLVNWWYATDGAGPAINVSFAVAVDGVAYSTASSPIVSGQLSGDALVTLASPAVITLINVTGDDVFIPSTPVQANIVITEVVD